MAKKEKKEKNSAEKPKLNASEELADENLSEGQPNLESENLSETTDHTLLKEDEKPKVSSSNITGTIKQRAESSDDNRTRTEQILLAYEAYKNSGKVGLNERITIDGFLDRSDTGSNKNIGMQPAKASTQTEAPIDTESSHAVPLEGRLNAAGVYDRRNAADMTGTQAPLQRSAMNAGRISENLRSADAARGRGETVSADIRIMNEIRQISEFDPAIQSIQDLPKMQNYDKFRELVQRGNTFIDAYKLANFDAIMQNSVQKNEQATRNRLYGKMHMDPLGSRGAIGDSVPRDVLDRYRSMLPDSSYSEIQKHYNNYTGSNF